MTARKLFMLILPVLLLMAAACTANAEEAENLTPRCTVKLASKGRQASKITDGDYRSYWESEKAKQPWVTLSSPEPIYGLYLCFEHMPESYVVEQASGSGWVTAAEGDTRFHHVFYELDGAKKIRIRSTAEGKTQIGFKEIFAFGAGEIPDWVQRWEDPLEKADILFIATHPDDDILFLGGGITYYHAERGAKVQVAYLTWSNTTRRSEALNGLWTMGIRNYPDFGGFRDTYTNPGTDLKAAYQAAGGKEKVLEWVTGMFRRYRPEVVVTQDIAGEYGHPQHRMVANAAVQCWDRSGDAAQHPVSAEKYGTWEVKKLYIHLYGEEAQSTRFDWEVPLESLGGKTVIQVLEEAYALHVTQANSGWKFHGKRIPFSVREYGVKRYPNNRFGLYASRVGEDTAHDDFLENVNGADE